jgi:hypothetical protein
MSLILLLVIGIHVSRKDLAFSLLQLDDGSGVLRYSDAIWPVQIGNRGEAQNDEHEGAMADAIDRAMPIGVPVRAACEDRRLWRQRAFQDHSVHSIQVVAQWTEDGSPIGQRQYWGVVLDDPVVSDRAIPASRTACTKCPAGSASKEPSPASGPSFSAASTGLVLIFLSFIFCC